MNLRTLIWRLSKHLLCELPVTRSEAPHPPTEVLTVFSKSLLSMWLKILT